MIFSLVLGSAVAGWISLGMGCAATGVVLLSFLARGRGRVQRSFDAAIVLLGAWTIVSARAFTGSTVKWVGFAEGAMLCALGVTALVVWEVLLERQLRHTRLLLAAPDGGDGRRAHWTDERAWADAARSAVRA